MTLNLLIALLTFFLPCIAAGALTGYALFHFDAAGKWHEYKHKRRQ